MTKRDYYEVLGIVKAASDEDIKKAYRKLAIQFHPDRNHGDKSAEEKFKEVNEAYQILSDPEKRAAYNQFGHASVDGRGFGGGDSGFASSFSDIFDNIFGGNFSSERGSTAVDLRYDLEITFEEAAFGVEKQISFDKEVNCEVCTGTGAKLGTTPKTCRTCRGSGQVRLSQGFFTLTRTCSSCMGHGFIIEEKCIKCRGRGRVKRPHSITVKVPAGIDSEQKLRLRGEGTASEPGGRSGDLYVAIHVKDHLLFRREGEHVILELPINFVQATLGAEIQIPSLSGPISLTIDSGTQSGDLIRLKGKGIKRLNGSGHGEMIVKVFVEIPRKLTSKQKELLKQFESESSKDSHPGVSQFLHKVKELFK